MLAHPIKIIGVSAIFLLVSCRSRELITLGDLVVEKQVLLHEDSFDGDMENWTVEMEPIAGSKVSAENGKIEIDVGGGATIWFNKKIEEGAVLIQYHRKVVMENGINDRLSDLNQFWMAEDPTKSTIFTRSGSFKEYDSLRMYYAGIGGNRNTTTRFRKYLGNGERKLIIDLNEKEYLLAPNKVYLIQILVLNGQTKIFVDGKEFFSFEDPEPLTEGYFGFRTVQSHQIIDDFKIFSISQN